MTYSELLLNEYNLESANTRKMLERVPFNNPEWLPHSKSMTIQRLASHVADIPQWMGFIIKSNEFDFAAKRPDRFFAKDSADLLAKYDSLLAESKSLLEGASDETLLEKWTVRRGDVIFRTSSKMEAIRNWLFNHTIHHRGQLSVYLRLNEVAVPGMYGPSADER